MRFSKMHARILEGTAAWPLDPKKFDPIIFFGRWFFSRKKTIPREWMDQLAERYPYSGKAYRLDNTKKRNPAPYASWCRTAEGLFRWKQMKDPLGREPPGFSTYTGTIERGVDLAAFVGDNADVADAETRKLILDVEEVFPVIPVRDMKRIWPPD